jgi:hypothetical protein
VHLPSLRPSRLPPLLSSPLPCSLLPLSFHHASGAPLLSHVTGDLQVTLLPSPFPRSLSLYLLEHGYCSLAEPRAVRPRSVAPGARVERVGGDGGQGLERVREMARAEGLAREKRRGVWRAAG